MSAEFFFASKWSLLATACGIFKAFYLPKHKKEFYNVILEYSLNKYTNFGRNTETPSSNFHFDLFIEIVTD